MDRGAFLQAPLSIENIRLPFRDCDIVNDEDPGYPVGSFGLLFQKTGLLFTALVINPAFGF